MMLAPMSKICVVLFLNSLVSSTDLYVYQCTKYHTVHDTTQYVYKYNTQDYWSFIVNLQSVQFSSVAQSCLTLCNPMNCSTPGLPVHHQLPEPTQTHVHWVSDAIQPSHPLSSPSPPALNLSQHQGLFKWVSSLHQVAKVLEFQLQHQLLFVFRCIKPHVSVRGWWEPWNQSFAIQALALQTGLSRGEQS